MGNNKESSKANDRGEFLTKNAAIVKEWPSWMKDGAVRRHSDVHVKTETAKEASRRSDQIDPKD